MSGALEAFIASGNATLQTIFVTLGGTYLARKGFLDKAKTSVISAMVQNLLLPCLVFTQILTYLDFQTLIDLLQITMFITIQVLIGLGLGMGFGKLTGANRDLRNAMGCCCAFNQATAIPIYFAKVLGGSGITGSGFEGPAITYSCLFIVLIIIFNWSIGFALMTKPKEKLRATLVNSAPEEEVKKPNSRLLNIWKKVESSLNPPFYAALLAIPLALIPYMKEYVFVDSGAALHDNLFASLSNLGAPTSAMILIVLGSNISNGYPPGCDISNLQIILVVLSKLVILPGFGLGFFYLLASVGFINKTMALMMMILYSCPTAAQVLMICNRQKNQEDNVTKVIVWVYLSTPFTMTTLVIIYLQVLY